MVIKTMKIKIQHRTNAFYLVMAGAIFAIVLLTLIHYNVELPQVLVPAVWACFGVFVGAIAFSVLQKGLMTTVTIENDIMTVKYIIGMREINIGQITRLSYHHYSDTHTDPEVRITTKDNRVRLDIDISAEGKTTRISLNDDANTFVDGNQYFRTDEEIGLYSVYKCLCDRTGIKGIDDNLN